MNLEQAHPDYQGKVAMVTGAGSGIGLALTHTLLSIGVNVLATYRSEASGERLRDMVRQHGGPGKVVCQLADTTIESDVAGAVDIAMEHFGALDIAFNNAGVSGAKGALDASDMDAILETIDTNLTGTILCMREQLRVMRPRQSGLIVNVSSVYGSRGSMMRPAYAASKHAILGITRSTAVAEAGNGIRVISVSPGGVDTPMLRQGLGKYYDAAAKQTPMGYFPTPVEVAHDIVVAANPTARHINGADIKIEGAAHPF